MISLTKNPDYTNIKVKKQHRAQDVIPIKDIYDNGMRRLDGGRYAMTFEIKDVDYASKNDSEREEIFDAYSKLLNSFDGSKSTYKLTICNSRVNKKNILKESMLPTDINDGYDNLRLACNRLRYDDIQGDKGFMQKKYITISTYRSKEEKAESYFMRASKDIHNKLIMFESGLTGVSAEAFGEIIYNFMRAGYESDYNYSYCEKNPAEKFRDCTAPDYIKFHTDYFEIGGLVGRCMMLKTIGSVLNDDFLVRLAEIKTNLMLSLDVIPVSNADARTLIERKDDDVEGNADVWSNKKKIREGSAIRLPRQVMRDRKIIDEYIEDMDENNQKMFLNQLTIVFLANNMEELQDYTDSLTETAAEYSAQLSILYAQQFQGLLTAVPFGTRCINNLRDCNTDTTAMFMPFEQVKINHSTGIPFGRHEGTKEQQMVDVRKLMNGHIWVVGKSGSGKSMNVKLKTTFEALMTDADIIWIDPDGECREWINAVGGQTISVGRDTINVADIVLDYGTPTEPIDPVKDSINNVLCFIEKILENEKDIRFGEVQKGLVDHAMRELYKSVVDGFEPYVTLEDLYDILSSKDLPEAQTLAKAITRFANGTFNYFSKPTNVDINSRISCYDLSTLDEQTKDVGLMVVLNHIERRLIRNYKTGRATYIKLDEADYLLEDEYTRKRLKYCFERFRKFGGFITAIIQNTTRILQIPEAHTMLLNAETVIMHKQERDDALELARMYGLSNIQLRTLTTVTSGHGINKIGDIIYDFDCTIPKDNELYKLINTDSNKNAIWR